MGGIWEVTFEGNSPYLKGEMVDRRATTDNSLLVILRVHTKALVGWHFPRAFP